MRKQSYFFFLIKRKNILFCDLSEIYFVIIPFFYANALVNVVIAFLHLIIYYIKIEQETLNSE